LFYVLLSCLECFHCFTALINKSFIASLRISCSRSTLFTVISVYSQCTFPFTYNGGLYYSCTHDIADGSPPEQSLACLNDMAIPIVCDIPGQSCHHYSSLVITDHKHRYGVVEYLASTLRYCKFSAEYDSERILKSVNI